MKIVKITTATLLIFALIYTLFDAGWVRFNYPSLEKFPVRGIDVSHHQGVIEWEKLPGQNISFAYIKATEGENYKDPKFLENWNAADKAGLQVGAYHFFTFCRSGKVQAKNFIESVPVKQYAMPIALDLEFGGNCAKEPSLDELLGEINDFLAETKKHYPGKPVFYVTPEFYNKYMKNNMSKFPPHYLWLRNIFYEPAQEKCEFWKIWQFANRGHVSGIKGPVDLNAVCDP